MKHIILIGLPGSGKTTLGRRLSKDLRRPFIDLDTDIATLAGMSIPDIFSQQGEEYFRQLESQALEAALQKSGCIISTGGGAILRAGNTTAMRQQGFVVFVDRPVDHIAGDVKTSHRPLLKDGAEALYRLNEQRRELYLAGCHWRFENTIPFAEAAAQLAATCSAANLPEFVVIGDPIAHSLSPQIHNTVFEALGQHCRYATAQVPKGMLPGFMAAAKVFGLKGMNVTIPHKQDILPLLDECEKSAALCGAVNTVVCKDNKLYGYNTDMDGFLLSLKRAGRSFTGQQVVVLGAGGAARAIALKAALEKAAGLTILSRNEEKSRALAQHIQKVTGLNAQHGGTDPPTLTTACKTANLLVHCTPLGMHGLNDDYTDLSFLSHLPTDALVCDLIYNPDKTRLLAQSETLGLATLNGKGMLLYQALLADEFFLGKKLEKDKLYNTVAQALPPINTVTPQKEEHI